MNTLPEYGYEIHWTHVPVNVEDVTLYHDWLCSQCNLSDEKLSEPCPGVEDPAAAI